MLADPNGDPPPKPSGVGSDVDGGSCSSELPRFARRGKVTYFEEPSAVAGEHGDPVADIALQPRLKAEHVLDVRAKRCGGCVLE